MRDFGEVSQLLVAFREASASGTMFKNIADAVHDELKKIDKDLGEKAAAAKPVSSGIGGMPPTPPPPPPPEEEKTKAKK